MHVTCPTTEAILLLGARGGDSPVLRVPGGRENPPGLRFVVKPLLPINDQLLDQAAAVLGADVRSRVSIRQDYADSVPLPECASSPCSMPVDEADKTATLYLATVDLDAAPPSDWPSMPELLRGMAKDRSRLPYLRAFQVLSGGLDETTKAIDVKDLAKYLQKED